MKTSLKFKTSSLNTKLMNSSIHLLTQSSYWFVTTLFFLIEICVLDGFLLGRLSGNWGVPTSFVYSLEIAFLFITFANGLYCLISYLFCLYSNAGTQLFSGSISSSSAAADPNMTMGSDDSVKANYVGSLCAFMASFFKQSNTICSKEQNISLSSTLSDISMRTSLSSLVGYHDSPLNRAVSSVHSHPQLREILENETCDSVIDPIDCSAFFNYDMGAGRLYQPGTSQILLSEDNYTLDGVKSLMDERKSAIYTRKRSDRRIFQRTRSDSSPKVNIETDLYEILNIYGLAEPNIETYELKLRIWLCNTIIRPIMDKIDEINKELAAMHLRIGTSGIEMLQAALIHKQDMCSSSLPFLLPYLAFHTNQKYIVNRLQMLGRNLALEEFKWNGGGVQTSQGEEEDCFNRIDAWNEQLPTDAELVWHLFCTYMDFHLSPSSEAVSSVAGISKPFSNVFFVKSSIGKFPLAFGAESLSTHHQDNELAEKFFIRMAADRPPIFELVVDGGENVILPNKGGPHNFWLVFILFMAHVKKFSRSRIGHLHISSLSLDIFDS